LLIHFPFWNDLVANRGCFIVFLFCIDHSCSHVSWQPQPCLLFKQTNLSLESEHNCLFFKENLIIFKCELQMWGVQFANLMSVDRYGGRLHLAHIASFDKVCCLLLIKIPKLWYRKFSKLVEHSNICNASTNFTSSSISQTNTKYWSCCGMFCILHTSKTLKELLGHWFYLILGLPYAFILAFRKLCSSFLNVLHVCSFCDTMHLTWFWTYMYY
jgi:hypothetical protein